MADLRTDYKDDVLNINTNERRKYRMINNADGTISFEDVTDYMQNGDSFGATDVNTITERVNRSLTSADVVDNFESTAPDLPFSANKGREMYVNGVPFLKVSSVIDGEGNPFRPGDFKDSAISFGYAYGATIGLNVAAYVPIITTRFYDTSDVIRTTQLAIMGTGTAVRYSTSETTWSDWSSNESSIVYTETTADTTTVLYPNGFSFNNCYIAACEVNVTADTFQSFYADTSGVVPMVQAIQTNSGATLVLRSEEAKGKIIRVIFAKY